MSVLSFIDGYMNGNAWEDLCVMCYRMRYQDEHYTPISAAQGGDGGIEGFTQNGIVHQFYCPEKNIQITIKAAVLSRVKERLFAAVIYSDFQRYEHR